MPVVHAARMNWRSLGALRAVRGALVIADHLAAAPGENRWTLGQVCHHLPFAAGGKPSEATAIQRHLGGSRGAAVAGGLGNLLSAADLQ